MTPVKELTGKHVFLYFLSFFGFITCVLAIFATIAINTHTGIVTQNPYEKGLAYNDVVRAEQAQQKLGWQSDIDFVKTAKNSARVSLFLKDKTGNNITKANVTAEFFRPTQSGIDFSLLLTEEYNGKYSAETKFPALGVWEIRIFVQKDKIFYKSFERVTLQ